LSGLVDKCFAEEEAAYWNKLSEDPKNRVLPFLANKKFSVIRLMDFAE
jgi:hypothetical protein